MKYGPFLTNNFSRIVTISEGISLLNQSDRQDLGLNLSNIVFATDFLESSRLALDYAVAFAHHYNASLTILHAFELSAEAAEAELRSHKPSLSREMASQRLEAFASGVRRVGITVRVDLRDGDPCAAVLGSVTDNKADLLVLGTHGVYRGLEHLLVGSNAEKILHSAKCPTLTVGRHVMAGLDLGLNASQILLVSDFTAGGANAAAYALSLGRDLAVPVELIQAVSENTPADPDRLRAAAEEFCKQLARNPSVPHRDWCDPDYHLRRRLPTNEILELAKLSANSLMVLGVQSVSRLNRHLQTSLAYELVARASCPLISIHD